MALVLASVGICGLISYRVSRSTRELGLRIAPRASSRGILGLVLRHGLALAASGVLVGSIAAVGFTGFLQSMLFGVDAWDLRTFATVASGLVAAALLACYVPARRAMRVSPLDAIAGE